MFGSVFRCLLLSSVIVFQIASGYVLIEKNDKKAEGECNLSTDLLNEIHGYKDDVSNIIDTIVNGRYKGEVHSSLQIFTDKFGSRMTGSQVLEDSINYLEASINLQGLENVHTEPVKVPHWVSLIANTIVSITGGLTSNRVDVDEFITQSRGHE